jgi:hypothetical protein
MDCERSEDVESTNHSLSCSKSLPRWNRSDTLDRLGGMKCERMMAVGGGHAGHSRCRSAQLLMELTETPMCNGLREYSRKSDQLVDSMGKGVWPPNC